VLRFDQQTEALVVRLQRQLDSSQTMTLVKKPTSGAETTIKTVENLIDDYVRFRLIVLPGTNQVSLQINDVGDDVLGGPIAYTPPSGTNRFVKVLGNARFDYVEVRFPN
jgi:hypothetical protein